jgi:hypothetical protein
VLRVSLSVSLTSVLAIVQRQRAEMHSLNAWVALCQFVLGLALSPLAYLLQVRLITFVLPCDASHVAGYSFGQNPKRSVHAGEVFSNFGDGFKCALD